MPRDEATLLDILVAARAALEFKGSADKDALWRNRQLQASILYELVVVGEGVRRLSKEFRETHGEIPWREIAGMRDHLVHAYDAVDLDEVWITLERDVPALIEWLEAHATEPRDSG